MSKLLPLFGVLSFAFGIPVLEPDAGPSSVQHSDVEHVWKVRAGNTAPAVRAGTNSYTHSVSVLCPTP